MRVLITLKTPDQHNFNFQNLTPKILILKTPDQHNFNFNFKIYESFDHAKIDLNFQNLTPSFKTRTRDRFKSINSRFSKSELEPEDRARKVGLESEASNFKTRARTRGSSPKSQARARAQVS